MKFFKNLGQKIRSFGRGLGEKIYSGSKFIGQKVYDNRYKIGGAALGFAAATAAGLGGMKAYQANKMPKYNAVPDLSVFPSVPN